MNTIIKLNQAEVLLSFESPNSNKMYNAQIHQFYRLPVDGIDYNSPFERLPGLHTILMVKNEHSTENYSMSITLFDEDTHGNLFNPDNQFLNSADLKDHFKKTQLFSVDGFKINLEKIVYFSLENEITTKIESAPPLTAKTVMGSEPTITTDPSMDL